jgi:hypothetical protein
MSMTSYLNEQLADETLGVELAKRAIAEHQDTPPLRAFLEVLGWDLEEDREFLLRLMRRLGVRRRRARVLAAQWLARSMRTDTADELEALRVRIERKREMWATLRFDAMVRRAEGQAAALQAHHYVS